MSLPSFLPKYLSRDRFGAMGRLHPRRCGESIGRWYRRYFCIGPRGINCAQVSLIHTLSWSIRSSNRFVVVIVARSRCGPGAFYSAQSKDAEISLRVKCQINRFEQSRVPEWLEQACHGAPFDESLAIRRISVSGNEDNRNHFA